uniref:Uncharacterized protein n=1 Tax=Lygus hesperus TaxID=30085 RepID=A0A146MFU2_LYGHE
MPPQERFFRFFSGSKLKRKNQRLPKVNISSLHSTVSILAELFFRIQAELFFRIQADLKHVLIFSNAVLYNTLKLGTGTTLESSNTEEGIEWKRPHPSGLVMTSRWRLIFLRQIAHCVVEGAATIFLDVLIPSGIALKRVE